MFFGMKCGMFHLNLKKLLKRKKKINKVLSLYGEETQDITA